MCGIAGYSLSSSSSVDQTLAAQTLLAAISERGSDAVGYAFRGNGLDIGVHKQRSGASEFLDSVSVPPGATQVLVHVRDYTKGHPALAANNHPIRHGKVVGIHNGIIANDEEIFALVERERNRAKALEQLYGSMATAWVDERVPDVIFAARGFGRPLWIGEGQHEVFFASTREAIELAERYAGVRLRSREVSEGCLLALVGGRVARREAFEPDRSFTEELLPAVRTPEERRFCLARLAALAATAAVR